MINQANQEVNINVMSENQSEAPKITRRDFLKKAGVAAGALAAGALGINKIAENPPILPTPDDIAKSIYDTTQANDSRNKTGVNQPSRDQKKEIVERWREKGLVPEQTPEPPPTLEKPKR